MPLHPSNCTAGQLALTPQGLPSKPLVLLIHTEWNTCLKPLILRQKSCWTTQSPMPLSSTYIPLLNLEACCLSTAVRRKGLLGRVANCTSLYYSKLYLCWRIFPLVIQFSLNEFPLLSWRGRFAHWVNLGSVFTLVRNLASLCQLLGASTRVVREEADVQMICLGIRAGFVSGEEGL